MAAASAKDTTPAPAVAPEPSKCSWAPAPAKEPLPNLAGVATQDLVEKIGTGKYSAAYINWSRTLDLLRTHAPGWTIETIPAADGGLVHRAPVGGYLLLRFRHVDGSVTPSVPQAIMDTRNAAIPYEKITARDVTDTHRRGACLAAAMIFGLAFELWAKLPLESGYAEVPEESASPSGRTAITAPPAVTREQFLEAALAKGLTTHSADALAAKLNGNYQGGIDRLKEKDPAWVDEFNKASAPKGNGPSSDGSKW